MCKNFGCSNDPRGSEAHDAYAGKFCSDKCEVKYDHIKMDAQDAMREDMYAE